VREKGEVSVVGRAERRGQAGERSATGKISGKIDNERGKGVKKVWRGGTGKRSNIA